MEGFINITQESIGHEHLCCAIADKKHQRGVDIKRAWLAERLGEGHVMRKLDEKGKVFIEYAPLEKAWAPVIGDNFIYIYCLWVSGSFKGKGYGRHLLEYCISDAREKGKSGVCVISSKKKTPFLSDKAFMAKHGFETADTIGDYELLALSFDGTKPRFTDTAKDQSAPGSGLTVYYGMQCPYIPNCVEQIENYCKENGIPLSLMAVDTLEKAKAVPGVFNNWAVFYNGEFSTVHLLDEGYLKKMLEPKALFQIEK